MTVPRRQSVARQPLGRKACGDPYPAGTAALSLEPPGLGPAHHQFRRRQHLGEARRRRSADRRRHRGAVGEGLWRRPRLDEARRVCDALRGEAAGAEEALSRLGPGGRDGRPPAPLHLRPQPARRLHRHAAARISSLPARRPHASRCGHRHRGDDEVAGADCGNLRRQHRLAAVAAAGLRAGTDARKIRAGKPEGDRRRAGEPRAVHVGAGRADLLRNDHRHDQQGDRLARRQDRHEGGVRRQGGRAGGPGQAPRRGGASDAGDPRRDRQGREEGRPFRRRAGGARIRQLGAAAGARGARHLLPRPFPAHQDPAACSRLHRRHRGDGRGPGRRGRGLSRRLRRLLRALPPCGQPGHARPEPGRLPRSRRRHDHLCPRQGDGAHRRRVLPERHQRHARRFVGRHLRRPARAGSLRHRVLAARGSQAPAHAEAEEPVRPHRLRDRRRQRHRPLDRGAASLGGRGRRHRRHRPTLRWRRPRRRSPRATARTISAASPWT